MRRISAALALIVMTAALAGAEYTPGRPWTAVIPDPDTVDWSNPDRPGYHYRGMLPLHEKFYEYIKTKRERGEELSMADNAMIRRLQTLRRWPEAPVPNQFWRSYLRYLREQTTDELNWAQRFMLWEAFARGLIAWDLEQDEHTRNVVEYLNSGPFRARNWFERCFGRVEPWMEYTTASVGIDMGGGGGAPGTVYPAEPFNGLQITYNVAGATLGEPEDTPGFTTSRRHSGVVHPGTLTVSGSGLGDGGYGATLTVRVWAGAEERKLEEWIENTRGGADSKSFSLSVPVAPGTTSAGFSIRLDGSYSMGGGHRGLVVSGALGQSAADAAQQRAQADAEWRARVEKTLAELGYEQTPGGRELAEMRRALQGGDAAWREYVDRKQRELGYQDSDAEAGLDELASALDAGGATWDQYAAAHGGAVAPPPPDVGGLQVGTGTSGGTTTGAADHFDQVGKVSAAMNYEDLPAGSVAAAVWTRDGAEVTRSQQQVGGTGWVSFSLFTQDAGGLQSGRYTLTITVGDTVLGRKTFTIGN